MADPVIEALADVCSAWPALVPPNRIAVSQGASENLIIKRPGGGGGPLSLLETPYMVDPMDTLGSRLHEAVCFVGPAQSGKTVNLGEGWMAHNVVNDPGDMLMVQMTEAKAREYSQKRINRAIQNSPTLRRLLGVSGTDDNVFDKAFRNGMAIKFGWPTATNFSSTDYRYVFGTDYDRWPDNIDEEGDGWGLMLARIRTFLSRGKVCVESSPGRPIVDPSWKPSTPHEAPPVTGILGIYNRSDRRRWYWKCPHCREWFEATPGLSLFNLPPFEELVEEIRYLDLDTMARQYARAVCPKSGCLVAAPERERMNRGGRWLADGLSIDHLDRISGNARTSSIAGFWLGGAAATYISWEKLIRKYLQAVLEYALNGNELPLQTTTNVDQGAPYASRHIVEAARDGLSAAKHDADMPRYIVPKEARFLVASVDVQGGRNARFEVQVHAVGKHKEQWLVDRYAIKESKREGMGQEFAPIDPASYEGDWDALTEKVVLSTYRLEDGREMRVRLTVVDSGGEDGVTDKAYAWYRRVRKAGLASRVRLTKGNKTRTDWFVRESMVGGTNSKNADVPLYLIEPNKFKDMVLAGRQRRTPGPGYYHFPVPKGPTNPEGWLPQSFFDELTAEVRGEDGVWERIRKRNETLDCCVMILAGCTILGVDKPGFWDRPPDWAMPIDEGNPDVITAVERREVKATILQPANAQPMQRRVSRSAYLGG